MRKLAVSLADSTDLRVILSVLYIIAEVIRSVSEQDSAEWHQLEESFRHDISKICVLLLLSYLIKYRI